MNRRLLNTFSAILLLLTLLLASSTTFADKPATTDQPPVTQATHPGWRPLL